MKKIKNILALLLLVFISTEVLSQQPFPDSVHIQIDSTLEILLALDASQNISENIENDLKSLQILLEESGVTPPESPYTITYIPDDLISVKPSAQKETVIWKDTEIIIHQFNNRCTIHAASYLMLIRFNEFSNLMDDNLITKIKDVVKDANNKQGRMAATYNYTFEKNNMVHLEHLDEIHGQTDMISLNGGVGANLIKNQPVIDISAMVSLLFSKKGVLKNDFNVSYNSLSYFNDSSAFKVNGFLNIGYRYNFSKDAENPNWLGVELGYLVNRSGNLFDKNTFRLGVNWKLGNNVSVSPQFYFSGKSTYPGLRIGFGF
ncbi:MAG: hypothetical protein KDC05_15895 [Bacteroidales bacterium]|nr:hypothetical protein [Bacteroidales bacterium]